jgi:phosphoadenosine phosphosulfate reductase
LSKRILSGLQRNLQRDYDVWQKLTYGTKINTRDFELGISQKRYAIMQTCDLEWANLDQSFLEKVDLNNPQDLLLRAVEHFQNRIVLASSFSLEDVTIIDMVSEMSKTIRIIALDTGRLDDETYECAQRVIDKYGVHIEWFPPDAAMVKKLIDEKGLYSFRDSIEARKECCFIRKVLPLQTALQGVDAWVTGQRQEQSVTRANLPVIQDDIEHGHILKLNPLASWSLEDVKSYVEEHRVPYNRLYDQSYQSIGCAPCTRATKPGEHERAGRWWWESAEQKECGIHR